MNTNIRWKVLFNLNSLKENKSLFFSHCFPLCKLILSRKLLPLHFFLPLFKMELKVSLNEVKIMNGQSFSSYQILSLRNVQQRMSTLSFSFIEIYRGLPAAGHMLNLKRRYLCSLLPVHVCFPVYIFLLDQGIL